MLVGDDQPSGGLFPSDRHDHLAQLYQSRVVSLRVQVGLAPTVWKFPPQVPIEADETADCHPDRGRDPKGPGCRFEIISQDQYVLAVGRGRILGQAPLRTSRSRPAAATAAGPGTAAIATAAEPQSGETLRWWSHHHDDGSTGDLGGHGSSSDAPASAAERVSPLQRHHSAENRHAEHVLSAAASICDSSSSTSFFLSFFLVVCCQYMKKKQFYRLR